jgi:hypothetical protein
LLVESHTFRREDRTIEETLPAEMEHHLRNAAGEEHLDGRVVAGAVGKCVDETRHAAADLGPVAGGRPRACGVGDRRNVEGRFVDPPNAACVTIAFRATLR